MLIIFIDWGDLGLRKNGHVHPPKLLYCDRPLMFYLSRVGKMGWACGAYE